MPIRLILRVLFVLPLACQCAFSQPAADSQQAADALAQGQAIFLQRCARCHGVSGQGVSTVVTIAGPSIQAVHEPGAVMTAMEVGPSHMPSFAYVLSVQQMRAVAEYVTQKLAIIPLQGGDVSEGGKKFRKYCAPCHRTAVRGGALAYADVNAPSLVGKSPALVAGAIRWGPGPMPSFPASVIDDKDLASIVKYVETVQNPPSPGGSPMHWYGPVAEGFVAWVVMFFLVIITGWIEKGGKG